MVANLGEAGASLGDERTACRQTESVIAKRKVQGL